MDSVFVRNRFTFLRNYTESHPADMAGKKKKITVVWYMTPCWWELLAKRHGVTQHRSEHIRSRTLKQFFLEGGGAKTVEMEITVHLATCSVQVRNEWRYASTRTYNSQGVVNVNTGDKNCNRVCLFVLFV